MTKARPVSSPSHDHADLLALLRNMLLQRATDTRGFQLNRQGKIGIAMGSEGHEAIQAGVGFAFKRGADVLFPYYRNTGVLLACGFPLIDLFRSQFARTTDRTGGRQIINHVTAHDLGIATVSSIIAAHLSHAVGTAWAIAHRRDADRVVFTTFGEGATSEGEWHESINFAAIHRLPIVFICENNQWAISTPQSHQMAVADVACKADGYGMPGLVVDGFDPAAVLDAVRTARERAVRKDGPTLIEAKCYRFLSHTSDDDDRTYRSREEIERLRHLDPIPRFERRLIELGMIDATSIERLRSEITAIVNQTTDAVEQEELPDPRTLSSNVYAGLHEPWL